MAAEAIVLEEGLQLLDANQNPNELEQIANKIKYREPQINFLSSWTGQAMHQESFNADYWKPHEPFKSIPENSLILSVQNHWSDLLQMLTHLYLNGITVNWKGFDEPFNRNKVLLPNYPFQGEQYWIEVLTTQKKSRLPETADPLLGELIPLPSKDILFRNEIDLNLLPYLQDHKIFHNIIFPGAGFAELLMRAGRHLFPNQSFTIKNLSFEQPLMFDLSKTTTIELYAKPKDDGYAVSIYSIANQNWILHSKGELLSSMSSPPANMDWKTLRSIYSESVDINSYYKQMDSIGANLGKKFQTIKKVWINDNDFIAEIEGEEAIISLDGSIQSLTLFSLKKDPSNTILPAGVDKLICFSEIEPVIRIHVRLNERDENNVKAILISFLEGKPFFK